MDNYEYVTYMAGRLWVDCGWYTEKEIQALLTSLQTLNELNQKNMQKVENVS